MYIVECLNGQEKYFHKYDERLLIYFKEDGKRILYYNHTELFSKRWVIAERIELKERS